jgi:hypothetical protein
LSTVRPLSPYHFKRTWTGESGDEIKWILYLKEGKAVFCREAEEAGFEDRGNLFETLEPQTAWEGSSRTKKIKKNMDLFSIFIYNLFALLSLFIFHNGVLFAPIQLITHQPYIYFPVFHVPRPNVTFPQGAA